MLKTAWRSSGGCAAYYLRFLKILCSSIDGRIHLIATNDDKLKHEMELIHEVEKRGAEEHDRTNPEWSNTVEMLLRKGAKAYKNRASKE